MSGDGTTCWGRSATKATTATPARSATNPAARRRRREGKVRREVVRGVTGHSLTRPDPTRASRPTAAAQEPGTPRLYLTFVPKGADIAGFLKVASRILGGEARSEHWAASAGLRFTV